MLGYLPAFILELLLIVHMRRLAGVESYGLLPMRTLLLWSLLVNAPVSAVTGILFPLACRWVQPRDDFPVAHVYILEAAGSFVGALGVTVLLASGINLVKVFLILSTILSGAVLLFHLTLWRPRRSALVWSVLGRCVLPSLTTGLAAAGLLMGIDRPVTRYLQELKWARLLPKEAFKGSFQTSQSEYLYGQYRGQWVFMCDGRVCETVPDEAVAGQIAATGLCQKPDARRILVVGSGLALCRQFLRLPQITTMDWCNPDSQFVQRFNHFLEPSWRMADRRFGPIAGDVRTLLKSKRAYYDIVVVNLPTMSSSTLNRNYTVEFYRLVKSAMSHDGVLMVAVAGGENVIGTELTHLGASTKATLAVVFGGLVLTPGEWTWFIASDSDSLTGDPAVLRDRFAAVEGAAAVFPPEALLSVYLPDRAAKAIDVYSHSDVPPDALVNRDARPLTYLYSLLVVAKQAGTPVAFFVQHLILAGPLVFFVPIGVFILVAALAAFTTPAGRGPSSFMALFLVFSTGWVGVGTSIVLMYLFQTRFGSLYLHIGVISCLFMLGLSLGAAIIRPLVATCGSDRTGMVSLSRLLFAVTLVQSLAAGAIAVLFTGAGGKVPWELGRLPFAAAFVLCGLCGGGYFPIAAQWLNLARFETGRAPSRLEMADHFGAAVGSVVTSLLLVPMLGTRMAMFVLVALVLANPPLWALALRRKASPLLPQKRASGLQRAGYALFAVGLSIVIGSNVVASSATRFRQALPLPEAAALAGAARIEPAKAHLPPSGREVIYFKVFDAQNDPAGWIFSSQDLAPDVSGFGGRMNLAIRVDADGRLVSFHIVQSNETPAYLQLLNPWYSLLEGRILFEPRPFGDVETVTGATVSSKAVLATLEASAGQFATEILGRQIVADSNATQTTRTVGPLRGKQAYLSDLAALYLIGVFSLALLVRFRGGFWSRSALLLATLVVGGVWLNAQYSIEQIVALLSLNLPSLAATSAFLLALGVPILILFFGNIYCGYICPFGAMQELLAYILPGRLKPRLPADVIRWGRFLKYIVLFILVAAFFLSRDKTMLSAEPLISVFNLHFVRDISKGTATGLQVGIAAILAVSVLAALFHERFWCRYGCPVGAFLSLFNHAVVLRRFLPRKRFARCQFDLTPQDHLDCIYCDRCRHPGPIPWKHSRDTAQPAGLVRRWGILASVVVIVAVVPAFSIHRLMQITSAVTSIAPATASAAGQPRDVDQQLIRTLIEHKKLSDKEAEFYREIE